MCFVLGGNITKYHQMPGLNRPQLYHDAGGLLSSWTQDPYLKSPVSSLLSLPPKEPPYLKSPVSSLLSLRPKEPPYLKSPVSCLLSPLSSVSAQRSHHPLQTVAGSRDCSTIRKPGTLLNYNYQETRNTVKLQLPGNQEPY